MLQLDSKLAVISAVNSKQTRIKLQKYKGAETTNIQFLVDYFSSDDTTSSPFKINIEKLSLHNVHFSYDNWNVEPIPYGMDYDHLEIKHLTGNINNIINEEGITRLSLDEIYLEERCGLVVENLTTDFYITPEKMQFDDIFLKTNMSNIKTPELSFSYKDFDDLRDFVYAVNMNVVFEPSGLHLKDLSYFVPALNNANKKIKVDGHLKGRINDFFLDSLYIALSPTTFFSGTADIKGLPDVENMVFSADIEKMHTSAGELESLDLTGFGLASNLDLPEEVHRLGLMKLSGSINGLLDDFETDLTFNSDKGDVDLDGRLYMEDSTYHYLANVNTSHILLGEILNNKDLGDFTSQMTIKGKGFSEHDLDTEFEGHFEGLDLLGYHYDKIDVEGHFYKKDFLGLFSINDENLVTQFNGELDFNHKQPRFDFDLDVEHAHLGNLKWIADRPTSMISGALHIKGKGMTVDDFNGEISIDNLAYYENGKDFEFDSIRIESRKDWDFHDIAVHSDFADISMVGDYQIDQLDESLYHLGTRAVSYTHLTLPTTSRV